MFSRDTRNSFSPSSLHNMCSAKAVGRERWRGGAMGIEVIFLKMFHIQKKPSLTNDCDKTPVLNGIQKILIAN